jgi:CheY-like chemotaxis protein
MKANILLVDSCTEIHESLSQILRLEGYDVTVASNGKEAVVSLRQTGFDLVLLDLDMPVSDGWDTLGQIITNSLSLPLIILTTRLDQQSWARQKGVTAVLRKPLEMNLLFEAVGRALFKAYENSQQRPESP